MFSFVFVGSERTIHSVDGSSERGFWSSVSMVILGLTGTKSPAPSCPTTSVLSISLVLQILENLATSSPFTAALGQFGAGLLVMRVPGGTMRVRN